MRSTLILVSFYKQNRKHFYESFSFPDTSLIDLDIQPTYVRVTMKGRILQLALNEEISPDKSTAQRSQTSGHLVVTMPKLKYILEGRCTRDKIGKQKERQVDANDDAKEVPKKRVERLEVAAEKNKSKTDYRNIVNDGEQSKNRAKGEGFIFEGKKRAVVTNDVDDGFGEDFVDDLDVPPLE